MYILPQLLYPSLFVCIWLSASQRLVHRKSSVVWDSSRPALQIGRVINKYSRTHFHDESLTETAGSKILYTVIYLFISTYLFDYSLSSMYLSVLLI